MYFLFAEFACLVRDDEGVVKKKYFLAGKLPPRISIDAIFSTPKKSSQAAVASNMNHATNDAHIIHV